MVHIAISDEDAAVLREIIEVKVDALKKEIWHTDHHEFRELLTARAAALDRVLAQVGAPASAS